MFEDYFTPKINETYEHYVFCNCLEKESTKGSERIDKRMREKLLQDHNLTLEKAIKQCQAH